jgi:hypothetical protein
MSHRAEIASQSKSCIRSCARGLVLAASLLAGSEACGQSVPAATQPTPKAAAPSTAKQPGGAAPVTNAAASAPGAAPRTLREAIAELLEGSIGFRSRLSPAPRIHDAKFIGPIQRSTDLFRSPEPIYCVSAKVDFPLIPAHPVALLRVVTDENAKQRIVATIGVTSTPSACSFIKDYGPFPELEAARERKRQALGIKD